MMPVMKPIHTSNRVCWRNIILLVPTNPAIKKSRKSHHVGLKVKRNENAITLPITPPIAAECVEIFQRRFISAQTTCTASAAIITVPMK